MFTLTRRLDSLIISLSCPSGGTIGHQSLGRTFRLTEVLVSVLGVRLHSSFISDVLELTVLAEQFALTEMAYTVVRILQNFDRIESRMKCDIQWKTDIVLQPAPSVDVAFFKSEK